MRLWADFIQQYDRLKAINYSESITALTCSALPFSLTVSGNKRSQLALSTENLVTGGVFSISGFWSKSAKFGSAKT